MVRRGRVAVAGPVPSLTIAACALTDSRGFGEGGGLLVVSRQPTEAELPVEVTVVGVVRRWGGREIFDYLNEKVDLELYHQFDAEVVLVASDIEPVEEDE